MKPIETRHFIGYHIGFTPCETCDLVLCTNSLPYYNIAGPIHLAPPITQYTVTTPPSCNVVGPIHLPSPITQPTITTPPSCSVVRPIRLLPTYSSYTILQYYSTISSSSRILSYYSWQQAFSK